MHRATAARILLIALGVATCTRDRTGPIVLVPAALTVAGGNSQTGAVGSTLAQPLVAVVRTASGDPVGGIRVNWHVRAGGGSISSVTATTDDQGHAAVALTLGGIAGTNVDSVEASVDAISGSTLEFTASAVAGPASQIGAASGNGQQGVVGQPLSDSLVVFALDQYGNPVLSASVSWTIVAGGGSLSPSVPTNALGRSAVRWTLGGAAGTQQVTATITGAVGSQSFTAGAAAGAAQILVFTQPPSTSTAGSLIAPAVEVSIEDAFGNVVSTSGIDIAVALGANPGGATLSGQTHRTTLSGVASYSDLSLDKSAAGYTLVASSAGLPTAASAAFAVAPAGGPRLVFTVVPSQAFASLPFAPAVRVAARDSLGNTITSFSDSVTLAIASNPGGAVLSGTKTVAAVAGVATFDSAWILKTGSGYTLSASAPGAATGVSTPFDVLPYELGPLSFTVQPSNTPQNSAISPAIVIKALDGFNNVNTSFTGAVTITLGNNPGSGVLSGTTTVSAIAGVATFSDLKIDQAGSGYTLLANAPGQVGGTSVPFQVLAIQFVHFVFTTEPAAAVAGKAIAPAVVVTATDPTGATVSSFTGPVSLALGTNPGGAKLSGTMTKTAVAGIATFSDLQLDKVAAGYTLVATSGGVTSAASTTFGVSAGAPARIVITAGNQQTAAAGTTLPTAYGVRVSDAFGNHIPAAAVSWTVATGGGSVSASQGTTDTAGSATTVRTLGGHAGAQTVVATVAGLADSAATFVATATPNGTISGTITLGSGLLAPPTSLRQSWSTPPAPAPQYTPDELIVTYRSDALRAPPIGSPALASPTTITTLGSAIHDRLAVLPTAARYEIRGISAAVLAARIRVLDSTELDQIAAALRQDPVVLSVERNGIVHLEAHHSALAAVAAATAAAAPITPTEPLYSWQAWHYGLIDLPRAWQITTGSASVLVAVVDNGIRYDHPAVAANLTHDGYDFVSDISVSVCAGGHTSNAGDGDGYDADPTNPADYDYDSKKDCVKGLTTSGDHGLHVSGTIGAVGNDGVGVTGVNWTVRIRPVRVLGVSGSGSFYDIAQGILYAAGLPADNGKGGTVKAPSAARVINVSLGGTTGSSTLHNAVIAATNAGALVVAAAGNDGSTSALYPAAYPEALAVSAVGPDGLLASYSTYGSAIDIAAPGGDITDGGGTYGVTSSVWNYITNQPAYDSWDGTSMATPHVTGVAALLLAQTPSLTVAQLRSRLTSWAVDAGTPGPDNLYGAGIVNARNSLTQSFAPPAELYALLYDATTGRLVATRPTTKGAYSFTGLDDGNYWVYGGADENGDGQIAAGGRPWGTLGGSASPTPVTVNGAATYGASFAVAQPTESEPNNTIAQANSLMMPGTLNGTLSTASDVDVVRILIAQAGSYTFETAGQNGACGFALEANTVLTLENASGTAIATNDDIDTPGLNYCSRVTATLAPGAYYVAVSGWTAGRYRLTARVGP